MNISQRKIGDRTFFFSWSSPLTFATAECSAVAHFINAIQVNNTIILWILDSGLPLLYKTFLLHCSVSVLSWFWCINCGVDVSWCTHSSLVLILNPLLCSFRGSICRSNKPGWIFVLNGFTSSLNFMTCYLNTRCCCLGLTVSALVWFWWIYWISQWIITAE